MFVYIDFDVSYMVVVNSVGNCYVWNLMGGIGGEVIQFIFKIKILVYMCYVLQCCFSFDFMFFVICLVDQMCKIWRMFNFFLMMELSIKSGNFGEFFCGWMWGCVFLGDFQYIVIVFLDNLVWFWCVEIGEIKREYGGYQKVVVCLVFNDSVLGQFVIFWDCLVQVVVVGGFYVVFRLEQVLLLVYVSWI